MSKKSFGFKVRIGFNHAKTLATLLRLVASKLSRAIELKDITPEHNLTGIEIVDNKDFSYSIIFNLDDELSIQEILDRAITGGITNE